MTKVDKEALTRKYVWIAIKPLLYCGIQQVETKLAVYKDIFRMPLELQARKNPLAQIEGFFPVLEPSNGLIPLTIPSTWSDAINMITRAEKPSVTCIVGAKGVGKSTMSRYLVNSTLGRFKRVAFLDCDLGQPELTPYGMISLHIIETPLIGPSYTHLKTPYRSVFVGSTSPKYDPDYYMACILELYSVYSNDSKTKGLPLVINTDGWVKGMGLDLLLHFVKTIRPDHVIQLLPNTIFSSASKNRNNQNDFQPLLQDDGNNGLKVLTVYANQDSLTKPLKFNPSDHRTLSVLSYFAQDSQGSDNLTWDFANSQASKLPYQVPFQCVGIQFIGAQVPISQTFHAINGTLVGLVQHSVSLESYEHTHHSSIRNSENPIKNLRIIGGVSANVLRPSEHNCLGWGIVRGIDLDKGIYYISVGGGLTLEQLKGVNRLVKAPGNDLPVCSLMDGFNVKASIGKEINVPYTTFVAGEGLGWLMAKGRKNLQRRRTVAT
ncbi:Polynucleotide 5'-hydroxyl-kinase nol9 [Chytridiales sp. JEL 0842]|nr:Polynucleotide 5'-hydroxyl-kinase nol9 [Chytridiales sp. JEL 0842]